MVILVGSTYYLYYSVSTFGSQSSAIGYATSDTMEYGSWVDHGSTVSYYETRVLIYHPKKTPKLTKAHNQGRQFVQRQTIQRHRPYSGPERRGSLLHDVWFVLGKSREQPPPLFFPSFLFFIFF